VIKAFENYAHFKINLVCWVYIIEKTVVLVSRQVAQQSMHLKCGILRDLQAFF
jgi:hypothetical protein